MSDVSGGACKAGKTGRDAKKELRRRIRTMRESLSVEEQALRSEQVVTRLMAMMDQVARVADRRVFALYYPTRNEVDVWTLIKDLWRKQKVVLFPRICPDTNLMEFRQAQSLDDFVAGPFKLMEPARRCPVWTPDQIEVVIVPGVAFNLQGYRIGFGGGYYDRFLPELKHKAVKIAPVFEFQIVDDLPHEAHDQKVDWLVSEARSINVKQGHRQA